MPPTREQLVKIARNVVTGPNRPSYCENPAAFDPDEWVLEAMRAAYEHGRRDGSLPLAREAGMYSENTERG